MLQVAQNYHYHVMWSVEDCEYVGLCTEFPSLSWLSTAKNDALQGIKQLLVTCVNDLHAQGECIPSPLSAIA